MTKPKILIVEDETLVAQDIGQQLRELGYDPVAETRMGEDAILLCEQLRPDLVLMDIQLAGEMDGVAAAQTIRERFSIPVVFLTALASDSIINQAKVTEPFGYIIKPFNERELRTVVEMALYKRKAEVARMELVRAIEGKNRELETLMRAISEDLHSPLLNIQGFSQRIATGCQELVRLTAAEPLADGDRAAMAALINLQMPKSLDHILTSVEKMDRLIGGLLRLSSLGRTRLEPETLDLNAMLREIVGPLYFDIQRTGAVIEVGALPSCHGDVREVKMLFTHLLENALKFRDPARPLQVTVSGRVDGGRAVYCVADTGVGIAPEHREKIWDLFFRANPDGPAGGEGLGLNLVRRIAERQQGEVRVESMVGEGSRFFVALPGPIA